MNIQILTAAMMTGLLAVGSAANATVINIDFNGIAVDDGSVASGPGYVAPGPTYVGTGPVGTGTFFNGVAVDGRVDTDADNVFDTDNTNITVLAPLLKDDSGVATGAKFTISGVGGDGNNTFGGYAPAALFTDYFYNLGSPKTFTISGLTGSTADLYFLPNSTTAININNAFSSTGTTNPGSFSFPYVYFDDVAIVGGEITGTVNSNGFGVVYALTIDSEVTAAPEPASLALLGLAIPLIARLRR